MSYPIKNIRKELLDTFTVEEILEFCDIDVEELIDHLIEIGWMDPRSLPPLELDFNEFDND